ncbi:MAG: hypothetical protein ACI9E1_000679 [Cryomorphaceae bacterium]|jgi:hypothetical protein
MKYKFKLSLSAIIIGLLSLNACNDKKGYVDKIRDTSAEVSENEESEPELKVELKPEVMIPGVTYFPESSKAPGAAEVPDENIIMRDEGGVAIAKIVPGKPGFVFNPFTNGMVDLRGIPAGTKVRDPSDPNPDHIFRVPNGNK